jgi:hypothetical protein
VHSIQKPQQISLSENSEAERIARQETNAALDKPVGDLVASIADLIRRIPPGASSFFDGPQPRSACFD